MNEALMNIGKTLVNWVHTAMGKAIYREMEASEDCASGADGRASGQTRIILSGFLQSNKDEVLPPYSS